MSVFRFPLVLLPGMNLSSRLWDRSSYASSATVVIPDGATIDQAVYRLNKRIDTPSVLVGLSLGGIVAMAFARCYPKKVAGLVLMATNPRGPTETQIASWSESIHSISASGDTWAFQELALPLLLSPSGLEDAHLVADVLKSGAEIPAATLINQLAMQRTRIDERPFLSEITVPVEVLAGRQDALCPVSNHEEIRDLISGAALEISEDSGHLIALEDPSAVDAAITRIYHRL